MRVLLPAGWAGSLGWAVQASAQQERPGAGTTPPAPGGEAPAGDGEAAVEATPPVLARPDTQTVTIDRDNGSASPAVDTETGGGTWLWVAIIVVLVLVVLALLRFLVGGGGRTRV